MPTWRPDVLTARTFRFAAGLGLVAAVGLPGLASAAPVSQESPDAATPADCAIQLQVANPTPGSELGGGDYVFQGTARDMNAASGNGIAEVQAFLGDRDNGGMILGSTQPQLSGDMPGAFTLTATLPDDTTGGQSLYFYGISALSGQEAVVEVPIALGTSPESVGMDTAQTATVTCPQMIGEPAETTTTTTGTQPEMGTSPATTPATETTTPASDEVATTSIHLTVANPAPGDPTPQGAYMVSGMAWDTTASNGAGIDHVDFFLGDRDNGGLFLGSAVPGTDTAEGAPTGSFTTTLDFPSDSSNGNTLCVYALSSVNGQEQMLTIPLGATAS